MSSLAAPVEPLPLAPEGLWVARLCSLRKRVSSRLGYALADQVVYSFGNMVVAALISRHCAGREFGIYILTQRSMDVLITLCNVFLWGPFTFNLPGMAEGRRSLYQGSILSLQLAFCVAFTLLLWGLQCWTGAPARGVYYGTFAPLVMTGAGILFREFTRRMYFAHMRMKEAFWTDVATVLLQITGVEWLYRARLLDVRHVLFVLCGGAVTVSLWWIARECGSITLNARATRDDLRLNLKLGRWFLGSNMVFLASSQCNPWVLSGLLGGSAVGAYAVCESVVNIPRVALTSMQNLMGPTMARARQEGGKPSVGAFVRRLDRLLLLGGGAFALLVLCVGPGIARLIFRTVPPNAHTILILLAINLIAYAATLAQSYGLTALGRADTTFYANLLGLVVQAGVCSMLVRNFHVAGAAAAMLLGSVVVFLVRGWFYRREMATA